MAIIVIGFALLFAIPTPAARASPQGSWDPTVDQISTLSPKPGSVYGSDIAIGNDGVTTVAWGGSDGLVIGTRKPGSHFEFDDDFPTSGAYSEQWIATGTDGSVVVAWIGSDGSVWAVDRTRTGSFGQPAEVAPPLYFGDQYPGNGSLQVATSQGFVSLAWLRTNGDISTVMSSTKAPGASFSSPSALSPSAEVPGRNAGPPRLAMDASGRSTVVWSQSESGKPLILASRQDSAGGKFGKPVILSKVDSDPSLVISGSGKTTVAWVKKGGADSLQYVTRQPSGSFSLPRERQIGTSSTKSVLTGMVISVDGTVTAAVRSDAGVEVMTRKPTGNFGKPILIATSDDNVFANSYGLTVSPDGTVNAMYGVTDENSYDAGDIWVTTRLPGGRFQPPVRVIKSSDSAPAMAGGPNGLATVIWAYGPGLLDFGDIDLQSVSTFPDDVYCESTSFSLGTFKTNRKSGTGYVWVKTGALGDVEILPSSRVKEADGHVTAAGRVKLRVKAKGSAVHKLKRTGSVRLTIKVRFRPGLGCADQTVRKRVRLLSRRER